MAGRGRFHRRGQKGHGASATQPRAAGGRGDQLRRRGVLRGRDDQADRGEQPRGRGVLAGRGEADGDRVVRGASARGARSGRARGRGARSDDGSDTRQGGTVQKQPSVGAKTELVAADGGKGKPKCSVECVICTDDHFTDQCPLLRDPKPSVAYCAASDDNGFFSIFRLQMSMT
jgi:hypothetical protein